MTRRTNERNLSELVKAIARARRELAALKTQRVDDPVAAVQAIEVSVPWHLAGHLDAAEA
jgi:hypothetical protein